MSQPVVPGDEFLEELEGLRRNHLKGGLSVEEAMMETFGVSVAELETMWERQIEEI